MAEATMTSMGTSRLGGVLPRLGFGLAILAGLLLAAAPVGYRTGLMHFRTTFYNLMQPAAFVAVGAVVISLVALVWWGRMRGSARAMALVGLGLGVLFVYYPVQFYAKLFPLPLVNNTPLPRIHDITTDFENPPAFVATLAPRAAEAGGTAVYAGPELAQQQRAGYPEIGPIKTALPAAEAYKRALATAQAMSGWVIVREDPATGTFEGSQRSLFMGFTDDFVIRVVPDGAGSRIDMRSESRQGISDFGVNAKRIRAYFAALKPVVG